MDQMLDVSLNGAGVNRLNQKQLSQGDLVDFDPKNVVEVRLVLSVVVLLLDANLAVIVELHGEQDVVCGLDLEVVADAQRMNHSILSFLILYYPALLLTECQQTGAFLRQNQEVVGVEQESLDW